MITQAPKVIFGGDYDTSQIYSKGYEFAFMSRKDKKSKTLEQVCPFVYCKDFLHDAIWAFLNKSSISIYDFKYKYGDNPPLSVDQTLLAFRNTQFKGKDENFHAMLRPCLEFLQAVDRQLGFRPTQIFPVEHEESPCWLIVADGAWQHAPPMISLFTLLVRLGCFHNPGDSIEKTLERAEKSEIKIGNSNNYAGNNDCSYVQKGRKGIDLILKHGLALFYSKQKDNYPKALRQQGLHDFFGIVSFAVKRSKKAMPHWYRSKFWDEK